MAEQQRVEKPKQTREQDAAQLAEDDAAVQSAQAKPAADTSDLDDILADIDAILEDQEVLVSFRQKGGE